MGRGRAKAKQQKVARELKYGGPGTDLDRLAAELSKAELPHLVDFSEEEPDDDKYADWIEADEEDVEEDELPVALNEDEERR
jgi:hypothetical protein